MLGVKTPLNPIRLCGVTGYNERSNDIVYCRPTSPQVAQNVVVYFGGDVQDFAESMQSHRDNKNYVKWNLENTAKLLQSGFPHSHIVVVRPSRMEFKTFSCFENFVQSDKCGAPTHEPMNHALSHLHLLLHNISVKLRAMSTDELEAAQTASEAALFDVNKDTAASPNEVVKTESPVKVDVSTDNWSYGNIHLESCDVKIVGFSKGCVVLNQLLYEFHYVETEAVEDDKLSSIIARIKDMYWLDGGHSGGKNTWITQKPLLETLKKLDINIHIHVTPYQIEDDRRPWIKKEQKSFHDTLSRLGASVQQVIHFPNMLPTLNVHFNVLSVFRQNSL